MDVKKSFIVYDDYFEHLQYLTNEEVGQLFKAMLIYNRTGEIEELDRIVAASFSFIRNRMDIDAEKYEEVRAARSEAGKRGMAQRWAKNNEDMQTDKEDKENNNKITNDNKNNNVMDDITKDNGVIFVNNKSYQTITKITDNDNDNDNDNDLKHTPPIVPPMGDGESVNSSSGESLTVQTARGSQSSVDQTTTRKKNPSKSDLEASFDAFWSVYPKHKGRQEALKAWLKLTPDSSLTKTILDAVQAQAKGDDWQRNDGQYIPHPATWINGKRWEDEPLKPINRAGSGKVKNRHFELGSSGRDLDHMME